MAGDSAGGDGRPRRMLSLGGLVVSVIAGVLGLLFVLDPGLKPCLGDAEAEFTGAPVFPHVRFRDYLVRSGKSYEAARKEPDITGAEIRVSFRTNGVRGEELPVTYSLLTIDRNGTLGSVVAGQDRSLAMTVRPQNCTQTGGKDLFVPVPRSGRRYRVVLELYRDKSLDERLALTQSEPFGS
jgi:hypothetical protein